MKLKGVARFRCPACGYLFKVLQGKVKNPLIEEVDEWLLRARCPKCGLLIKAHKVDTRGWRRSIC